MATHAEFDVIVVGAGIVGSCTAYHLARNGNKTLLLEQFPLPHSRGSSHGQSRIIRKIYVKDIYSSMMGEAYKEWTEIEKISGQEVLKKSDILYVCEHGDSRIPIMTDIMTRNKFDHKIFSRKEIKSLFPMFKYTKEDGFFMVDYEAGILKADKCLNSVQRLFKKFGGVLRDGEEVKNITPGDTVIVQTDAATYNAKRIVICAGPWTSKLLKPLQIVIPLQPIKVTVCYYKERVPGTYKIGKAPTTIHIQAGVHTYSLPSYEYPNHLKASLHSGPNIEPDSRDKDPDASKTEIETLNEYVKKHFPGVQDTPSIKEHCIYTMTPDEDFILDRHPRYRNIVIGAGFSGHGFKMAPVVGKILMKLAIGQRQTYDLSSFRINRFQAPKASM